MGRARRQWARDPHEDEVLRIAETAAEVCRHWADVTQAVKAHSSMTVLATASDIRAQLDALVPTGFITTTPESRLPQLVRCLKAAKIRLEKAALNPAADDALAWQVQDIAQKVASAQAAAATHAYDAGVARTLNEARWMLEDCGSRFSPSSSALRGRSVPRELRSCWRGFSKK